MVSKFRLYRDVQVHMTWVFFSGWLWIETTGENTVPEFIVLVWYEPSKKISFYTSRIVRAKLSDRAINFCQ